jgi:hypothetical protein
LLKSFSLEVKGRFGGKYEWRKCVRCKIKKMEYIKVKVLKGSKLDWVGSHEA